MVAAGGSSGAQTVVVGVFEIPKNGSEFQVGVATQPHESTARQWCVRLWFGWHQTNKEERKERQVLFYHHSTSARGNTPRRSLETKVRWQCETSFGEEISYCNATSDDSEKLLTKRKPYRLGKPYKGSRGWGWKIFECPDFL